MGRLVYIKKAPPFFGGDKFLGKKKNIYKKTSLKLLISVKNLKLQKKFPKFFNAERKFLKKKLKKQIRFFPCFFFGGKPPKISTGSKKRKKIFSQTNLGKKKKTFYKQFLPSKTLFN